MTLRPSRGAGRSATRRVTVAAVLVVAVLHVVWLVSGVRLVGVDTDSMAPGLGAGSHALVVPLDHDSVERGEVVVFDPPEVWQDTWEHSSMRQDGTPRLGRMVKRVLAVAGDELVCCEAGGHLLRNGERIDEDYLMTPPGKADNPTFRVIVAEGSVWLMGDNRPHSFDSRAVQAWAGDGAVPLRALRYRVICSW